MLKRLKKCVSENSAIQRFNRHRKEFKYIWILLLFMSVMCVLAGYEKIQWPSVYIIIKVLLGLIAALFLIRPMNAVYGLMGTSSSIRLFFFNFILITFLFAGAYYFAFYKYAGITYDVNQPHMDFNKYTVATPSDSSTTYLPIVITSIKRDTVYVEHLIDTTYFAETIIQTHVTRDTIVPPISPHYQPIKFWQVWRSTILTTLTQEPADLLTIATVHNEAMESTNVGLDEEKSNLFEWILIFHIIISWIFFGVFISLLYNKFRYES